MKRSLMTLLSLALIYGLSGCGSSSSGNGGSGAGGENGTGGGNGTGISKDMRAVNNFVVAKNAVEVTEFVGDDLDYTQFVDLNMPRALEDVRSGDRNCDYNGSLHYVIRQDSVNGIREIDIDFRNCQMERDLTYNGAVKYRGNQDGRDYTITFNGFSKSEEDSNTTFDGVQVDRALTDTSLTLTLNGSLRYAEPNLVQNWSAHNFAVAFDLDGERATALTISGDIGLESTPATCADGNYTIETVQKVDLNASGDPVAGELKINDMSYQFNSDGSITTSVDGHEVRIDPETDDINCTILQQ